MKQRITPTQLTEISEEQKVRLMDWWNLRRQPGDIHISLTGYIDIINKYGDSPDGIVYPILSIGQMIEFLQDGKVFINDWGYDPKDVIGSIVSWFTIDQSKSELADVLWEVVIKHLNQ